VVEQHFYKIMICLLCEINVFVVLVDLVPTWHKRLKGHHLVWLQHRVAVAPGDTVPQSTVIARATGHVVGGYQEKE
jgi:hypothetical protein